MKITEVIRTERRKCRIIAPFVFCILELIIFFELAYIYIDIFSFENTAKYFLIASLIYYISKSFKRTYKILKRCNIVKNQKMYIAEKISFQN